jgi:WD40 repeat protein/serine/threonine protein kinase
MPAHPSIGCSKAIARCDVTESDRRRIREIFMRIADLPADEQHAALNGLTGDDAPLRAEVKALLHADQAALAAAFMKNPTARAQSTASAPITEGPGTRVGPYKILQLIGEGGFGSVFLAEQEKPVRRRVALKIIKLGMDTRQVIARFEAERQALALMDHPHIAKVHDAGMTDAGRPYFVMEYVVGDSITAFADAHKLSVQVRLELFRQVCAAVQHAHTKGIIHRDIKPGNVIVSMVDGRPLAKIIDFGIAKATAQPLTEKTLFTEHRQLIGTLEYMSPEQAAGLPDIDTRTDVYSLGVLLYELLTGSTPLDGQRLRSAAFDELRRIVREEEPPLPSLRLSRSLDTIAAIAAARQAEPARLGTMLRGELDWIIMRALEKDRARRYETASGLAADVQRHLDGDAVEAAPPGVGYRMRKFVRKHKGPVVAGSAVVSVLFAAVIIVSIVLRQVSVQRDRAKTEEQRAERALEGAEAERQRADDAARSATFEAYAATIGAASSALAADEMAPARDRLESCPVPLRNWEWNHLGNLAAQCLHVIRAPAGIEGGITSTAFSPDGRHIAAASGSVLRILDARSGEELRTMEGDAKLSQVAYSPDGRQLLAVGADNAVRLWDTATTVPPMVLAGHDAAINAVMFSPDGSAVLTASNDGFAVLWSAVTCKAVHRLDHEGFEVHSGAFSPDGRKVVTAAQLENVNWGRTAEIRIWNVSDGSQERAWSDGGGVDLVAVAFASGGHRILSSGHSDNLFLWDAMTRKQVAVLPAERWCVSSDGRRIVTTFSRGTYTWDAMTGDLVAVLSESGYGQPEFSADGSIVVISRRKAVRVLDSSSGRLLAELMHPHEEVDWAQLSPDGALVLSRVKSGIARVWDLAAIETPPGWTGEIDETDVASTQINTDGTRLLLPTSDGLVRLHDARDGSLLSVLRAQKGNIRGATFSPDGARFATASDTGVVDVQDSAGGEPIAQFKFRHATVPRLTFNKSGNRLLAVSDVEGAVLLDAGTGDVIQSIPDIKREWRSASFSADGDRLLAICHDQTMRVFGVSDGAQIAKMEIGDDVRSASFSPDGSLVLTTTWTAVEVWDVASGRQFAEYKSDSYLSSAEFSPDGGLVVMSTNPTSILWDFREDRVLAGAYSNNMDNNGGFSFSPDARCVVAIPDETGQRIRLLDATTGDTMASWESNEGDAGARFSPNGTRLLVWSATAGVVVVESSSGQEICRLLSDERVDSYFWEPNFTHDGARVHLLTRKDAGRTHRLAEWDAETGLLVREIASSRNAKILLGGNVASITFGSIVASQHPKHGHVLLADDPVSSFSDDGSQAFVEGDSSLRLYDVATSRPIADLWRAWESDMRVAISPVGALVASVNGSDSRATIRDAMTGEELVTLRGHDGGISAIVFSGDGRSVLTGSRDGTARIWDAALGDELSVLPLNRSPNHNLSYNEDQAHDHPGAARATEVTAVAWTADGGKVALGGSDGVIRLVDPTGGGRELCRTSQSSGSLSNPIEKLVFCPLPLSSTGLRFIAWSGGSLRLYDAATGHEIAALQGRAPVWDQGLFPPDGAHIVTACNDGSARVWDTSTGKQVRLLHRHTLELRSAMYSADGAWIITASADRSAIIWDTATGEPVGEPLIGHDGDVLTAAFNPDKSRVVTASLDGTLRVWDTVTGKELLTLRGPGRTLRGAVFTPGGESIVAFTPESVHVWNGRVNGNATRNLRISGGTGSLEAESISVDQAARRHRGGEGGS